MNKDHWILFWGWCLFGVIHSIMATTRCKSLFSRWMGRYFRYYRFAYSLLALISLCAVLAWQFSIHSRTIASWPRLKYLVGLPAGLIGLFFMWNAFRKYFFNLSGVAIFSKRRYANELGKEGVLETGGLYSYVRHPLYLGTLLFIWSLFLFFPLLNNLLACGLITLYTLAGIYLEEKKLLNTFGEPYAAYRRKVPMLIPRLRGNTR
jgi:protein-S-isoprenylcysteine O-methyltransferase Ste14